MHSKTCSLYNKTCSLYNKTCSLYKKQTAGKRVKEAEENGP